MYAYRNARIYTNSKCLLSLSLVYHHQLRPMRLLLWKKYITSIIYCLHNIYMRLSIVMYFPAYSSIHRMSSSYPFACTRACFIKLYNIQNWIKSLSMSLSHYHEIFPFSFLQVSLKMSYKSNNARTWPPQAQASLRLVVWARELSSPAWKLQKIFPFRQNWKLIWSHWQLW